MVVFSGFGVIPKPMKTKLPPTAEGGGGQHGGTIGLLLLWR